MTPDELNSIDINNAGQVKRVQEFLKKQGYYGKKIDGVWGEGMVKARKDFSTAQGEKEARDAKEAGAKAQRDEAAADAAAVRAEKAAEAKAIRDGKKATDDAALASKAAEEKQVRDAQTGAVTAGSAGGGLGLGLLGGKIADTMGNAKIKEEMGARAGQLSNLAGTSRAIDPTSSAARALHTDVATAADAGRLTKTPIPWGTGALGSALMGMGLYSTLHRAPEAKSDMESAIWNGTGYGEGAAGVKILGDSLRRYKNPGMSYPADDVAAIEGSRRIAKGGELTPVAPPRGTPPYTPPAAPPAPPPASPPPLPPADVPPAPPPPPQDPEGTPPKGKIPHSERLINAAREAGATGPLNKASATEYLNSNLSDANRGAVARALGINNGPNLASRLGTAIGDMASKRGVSSIALPLLVGGAAYESTRSQANAANGGAGAGFAPAIAGGTAAGITAGAGALAKALGPMAGRAITAAGPAMAAYGNASEAQGYRENMSPEQRGGIPGALAHAMPLAMRGASDIASIQSTPGRLRDALSSAMTPGNAQPEEYQGSVYPEAVPPQQAQPEPFATARALQIPEGIPPNAARDAEMAAMQQQAAPQQQAPMMQAAALDVPSDIPPDAAQQAEMQAAFHPQVQNRLQRMIALDAPPEAIAQFLNSAAR